MHRTAESPLISPRFWNYETCVPPFFQTIVMCHFERCRIPRLRGILKSRNLLFCCPDRLLAARTMYLVAQQIHAARSAGHTQDNPPRPKFWGWFALRRCLCCRPVIWALMDRGDALPQTLPIPCFSSFFVSGLESGLVHPLELARHGAHAIPIAVLRKRRAVRLFDCLHKFAYRSASTV